MLPIFTTQGDAAPASLGKVELDLEGAPFLEPDPEPEAPSGGKQAAAQDEGLEDGALKKKNRKKFFILVGAIFVALILAGLAAMYFLVFSVDPVPSTPPDEEAPIIIISSQPPQMPLAPVDKFSIALDPFWIEVADPEGEIRFVYCKMILITDNQQIALQVQQKEAMLRDAIYYFFKNKSYSVLADFQNLEKLRVQILDVINPYIIPQLAIPPDLPVGQAPPPGTPTERLKGVLIEEYLIK